MAKSPTRKKRTRPAPNWARNFRSPRSRLVSSARTTLARRVNLARADPLLLVGLVCADDPRLPGEPCPGLLLFSCLASSVRRTLACRVNLARVCSSSPGWSRLRGRPSPAPPVSPPTAIRPLEAGRFGQSGALPSSFLLPTPYFPLPTPCPPPNRRDPGMFLLPTAPRPFLAALRVPSSPLVLFPFSSLSVPLPPLWPIFYLPALPFYLLSFPIFPFSHARLPARPHTAESLPRLPPGLSVCLCTAPPPLSIPPRPIVIPPSPCIRRSGTAARHHLSETPAPRTPAPAVAPHRKPLPRLSPHMRATFPCAVPLPRLLSCPVLLPFPPLLLPHFRRNSPSPLPPFLGESPFVRRIRPAAKF